MEADLCVGCGVRVAHCPQEAIDLVRDPAKGEPLEIQKLIVGAATSPHSYAYSVRSLVRQRSNRQNLILLQ